MRTSAGATLSAAWPSTSRPAAAGRSRRALTGRRALASSLERQVHLDGPEPGAVPVGEHVLERELQVLLERPELEPGHEAREGLAADRGLRGRLAEHVAAQREAQV